MGVSCNGLGPTRNWNLAGGPVIPDSTRPGHSGTQWLMAEQHLLVLRKRIKNSSLETLATHPMTKLLPSSAVLAISLLLAGPTSLRANDSDCIPLPQPQTDGGKPLMQALHERK